MNRLISVLKSRYLYYSLSILLVFALMSISLAGMQIQQGQQFSNIADDTKTRTVYLPAVRGRILDRYGRVIASSRPAYCVQLMPGDASRNSINSSVMDIVALLRRNGDRLQQHIPVFLENGAFHWEKSGKDTFLKQHGLEAENAGDAVGLLCKKYSVEETCTSQQKLDIVNIRCAISKMGYLLHTPLILAKDISKASIAEIEERYNDITEISIGEYYVRQYPNGNVLSPSLGYIGKITETQSESYKEKGYDIANDLIGRAGIEQAFEPLLRGKAGSKLVMVDRMGRAIKDISVISPQIPEDVYLSIDLKLQKTAEESLQKTMSDIRKGSFGDKFPDANVGAAVALDINTGEILAIASLPNYDPDLFASGGISAAGWNGLNPVYKDAQGKENLDPTLPRPMLNNAISSAFPPGSTFKMVVGAAALMEGIIGIGDTVYDYGKYTAYSKTEAPGCWKFNEDGGSHGYENIVSALRDSCNYYFFTIGDKLGIANIEKYAKLFGLGEKTGVEISGETAGLVAGPESSAEILQAYVGNQISALAGGVALDKAEKIEAAKSITENYSLSNIKKNLELLGLKPEAADIRGLQNFISARVWRASQILPASIGQGEHNYSVLQMANYIAALANGKTLYTPTLLRKPQTADNGSDKGTSPDVKRYINLPDDVHDALMQGLGAVTSNHYQGREGTAARFFRNCEVEIGGKTGTAQAKDKDSYAWFLGFAPYDKPRIAVAVLIARGGHGAYAAPVARAIIEEYMGISEKLTKVNGLN